MDVGSLQTSNTTHELDDISFLYLRSYITSVVKFCEKKGNEKLVKHPSWFSQGSQFHNVNLPSANFPLPRKDKYNRKLLKYYVEVDEEDEDEDMDEEREKEEHRMDAGDQVILVCSRVWVLGELSNIKKKVFFLKTGSNLL